MDDFNIWRGTKNPFGNTGSTKTKTSCPKTIQDQLRVKWWKCKYEGSCFCCGRKLSYEHVEAGRIKAGGKYTVPNTRLICKTCNRGMGKTNLKIYMKRNYPERYKKCFAKEVKKDGKKKPRMKKPKEGNIFGGSVFGQSPKRQKNNPFGFNI